MKRIRLAFAVTTLLALSASAAASSGGDPNHCLVNFPGLHFLYYFLPC